MAERYANYNRDFPLRPLGRDEDGHKRYGCRKCGKMVPKRCRSFCSEECRRDVLVRCGVDVRYYVKERDDTYCARCGVHVSTVRQRIDDVRERLRERDNGMYPKLPTNPDHDSRECAEFRVLTEKWHMALDRRRMLFRRFLRRIGLSEGDLYKSLWEAHHKEAVKDGGGGCGLEGLETLCRWCHKSESAAQQKNWAKQRRAKKEREQGQMSLL